MIKWISIIVILFVAFSTLNAQSYTVEQVPNVHLQNKANYVSNPDGIISKEAESRINTLIASVENRSTAEIAVVLLSSIDYEDIDNFATNLFTHWGIGKNNDNGLLFLLVYDQSQMVFRTGYGLEGVLPDIVLSRIIRNDISPQLRNGNFDEGIIAGITKVYDYLNDPDAVAEIMQQEKDRIAKQDEERRLFFDKLLKAYLGLSFVVFILFSLFYLLTRNSKSPNNLKYNKMDKAKKTVLLFTVLFPVFMILFFLFFLYAKKHLRNLPVHCPECGQKMKKLSEEEEDSYLNKSQITEEVVKSLDYDVWLCPNDGQMKIIPYENSGSKYTVCPYCHAKTYFLEKDIILKRATTYSKGKGEIIYSCKNCGKQKITPYIIPMIVLSSGGSGRGGSFGGGSSGGSWGGGRTGGGGARGGW